MFVTMTRFTVDPALPLDDARFRRAADAARRAEGWVGAWLLRSVDDPGTMLRITAWTTREAREAFQASDAARNLGLGLQTGAQHWQVVATMDASSPEGGVIDAGHEGGDPWKP